MDSDERTRRIREDIDAFIRVMRLHHRIVEKRVDGYGVHHSQHRTLMKISRLGKSASQKELAAMMGVSPACVARTLKQLSAAGFVEKTEGLDGRCNEVSLAPAGRRVVEDSQAMFQDIGEEMFRGLTGQELIALGDTFNKILNNLSNMESGDGKPTPAREKGVDGQ